MDKNGKNVKRLTTELGYDGGAFYSPDCETNRLSRFASETDAEDHSEIQRFARAAPDCPNDV